ncbi:MULTISPECIES: hypothetical protein [Halorubrum]|uniref:Glutamate--cysteine ligase n=1 Tax=Halorubrum ezzemoulense TaxID=337243 RepID=A0A256K7F0_HALEZ|nr:MULTISPECIES: hypothetical protein [Halorubrum]OYR76462.1 hypothetical protein DJ77_09660 [Halorubrum ezzemoulense]OYR81148.1 hypothetical protein DJ84_13435 [Halorubrum ezzemoulense]PHQ42460.1 hypothetical protein Z052_09325 [Halorubrum sp. C191]QAY19366.1 hypothetical protein EO776_04820 [Halorubrum ezzemoulense]
MTTESALADGVREALSVDAEAFAERAAEEAEIVKQELRDGSFDNHQSIVGFEYEFYAVGDGRWSEESRAGEYALMRVPRRLLELMGFEKELGLHNAEMSTSPQPLSDHGLRAQLAEVRARLEAAENTAGVEGMRLVSDGLWTIPPAGETAEGYLTDSVAVDGVVVAVNMSDAVRYHAMANSRRDDLNATDSNGGAATDAEEEPVVTLDAPGVSLAAETVMPESLITSIQPHYQVAHAETLPRHFRYALRIAGPLLALGVNSPFFPPALYDDGWDGERVLAEGATENRVHVFESVLNARTDADKVRFPREFRDVETAVDRIAADETLIPMPDPGGSDRFDDDFATFRTKHGSYWRWVRPVFEGASRSAANARIEFRPIPGQPTVRDSIAFQAAFAGLMQALAQHEHPVIGLEWETARDNFYAAVADGLDADMEWIDRDGHRTTDSDAMYADLLDHAEAGLRTAGCADDEAAKWIAPLRWRVANRTTPASWKRDRVRARLDDGDDFATAVVDTQREYIRQQADALIDGGFSAWTDGE